MTDKKTIKFNDRFSFFRDSYCWNLQETYTGTDKSGKPKPQTKVTYHPNLWQVCQVIIDRSVGDCESLEEIKELLQAAVDASTKYAESLSDEEVSIKSSFLGYYPDGEPVSNEEINL
jgi:hypothetical protein